MKIGFLNLFPRLAFLIILAFPSLIFAEECRFQNVSNVILPSAEHDKDSICKSTQVQDYESLFYYSGNNAVCADNKAVYCAKVEEKKAQIESGSLRLSGFVGKLPLAEQYWVKAFSYCGFDYQSLNYNYCESLATEGEKPSKHAELNCKPEQLAALAERVCGGGRSYSAYSMSLSAWCGKNYKKADLRSKKIALEPSKDAKDALNYNAPCEPRQIKFASSKSSSNSNVNSSNSTSANNTLISATDNLPLAPSGVGEAFNKAKKLKDIFGF
jgi:hypothetical protein